MTHPFDEIAIEAALMAIRKNEDDAEEHEVNLDDMTLQAIALTAAWASLVERGLAPKPEEPWETRERPTIDELEKMLTQDDEREIEILPNGQIRTRKASGQEKPLTMKENLGGEYSRPPHTEG